MIPMRPAALSACVLCATALAGPLTPPAGPPAPTNKTLHQVEPRTPIDQASIPIVLVGPGSYYLTENVTSPAGPAITITGPGVTLDLGGFAVRGAAGAGFACVDIAPSAAGARVHNGLVLDSTFGVQVTSGGATAPAVGIDRVHAFNCEFGFTADAATLSDCTSTNASIAGFRLFASSARGCVARLCSVGFDAQTSRLDACASVDSANSGFSVAGATTLRGCIAVGGLQGYFLFDGSSATQCVALGVASQGFVGNNGCHFDACSTSFCGVSFDLGNSSAADCSAVGSDLGYVLSNGSSAVRCRATLQQAAGFELNGRARVDQCIAHNNTADPATAGFIVNAGDAMLTRCFASNNSNNYIILVPAPLVAPITNTVAGAGPWDNFVQ